MAKTLLVYSGGLDSSSALHVFSETIGLAVSFNYGSKHNEQEIRKAKLNCERLGIPHKVIDLSQAFHHIKSALLDESRCIPEGHYESETMKATVVPFRNGIMLSIAAGIADSAGLDTIMLASHRGDHAVYPDCTPTFNKGMKEAIKYGTENNIVVVTPFENLDKREIAGWGIEMGMVAEQTYSCYKGGDIHCGRCSTCTERLWALDKLEDGTEYLDNTYWKEIIDE